MVRFLRVKRFRWPTFGMAATLYRDSAASQKFCKSSSDRARSEISIYSHRIPVRVSGR